MTGNKYPRININLHKFYDSTPKRVLMEMLVDYIKQLGGEDISSRAILRELEKRKLILR